MAKDHDETISRLDFSNLSADFSEEVTQLAEKLIASPEAKADSEFTIVSSVESRISPSFQNAQASGIKDEAAATSENIEISYDDFVSSLEPGEAAVLFGSAMQDKQKFTLEIKAELVDALADTAETLDTSPSVVLEAFLRKAFPDSWEREKESQFHHLTTPKNITSIARNNYEHDASGDYAELDVSISGQLFDFLEKQIESSVISTSFAELIEQSLENKLQNGSVAYSRPDASFDHT